MTTEIFNYTSQSDPEVVTLPNPVAEGTTPSAFCYPGGKGTPAQYATQVVVNPANKAQITVYGLPLGFNVTVEYEAAAAPPAEVGFTYQPVVEFVEWPDTLVPSSMKLQLVSNTSRLVSPFGRYSQTQQTPGARWMLEAEFNGLTRDQADELRALAAKLRGSSGMFYFKAEPGKAGAIDPQVVIDGAMTYQGVIGQPRSSYLQEPGQYLYTKGWPVEDGTKVFSAGDYVAFDDFFGYRHLHMVVSDASAYSGQCSMQVEPPLRAHVPADTAIFYENPTGLFRLADDAQLAITERPGGDFSAKLSAVQAVNPAVLFPLERPDVIVRPAVGAVLELGSLTFGPILTSQNNFYQVLLTNTSQYTAENVTIELAQNDFVSILSTNNTGTLEPGSTIQIDLVVNAPYASYFYTTLSASADNADRVEASISGQAVNEVPPPPPPPPQAEFHFENLQQEGVNFPPGLNTTPSVQLDATIPFGMKEFPFNPYSVPPKVVRVRNYGGAGGYVTFVSWGQDEGTTLDVYPVTGSQFVPAGGYLDISFYFLRADSPGNYSGFVQVSAPGLGVQTIYAYETVYLPTAEVTVAGFPVTKVNTTSAPQVIATLTNTGEDYPVDIRDIPFATNPYFTDPNATVQFVSTTCGDSLAPGESCTVTAKFRPPSYGASTFGIAFSTDATDGTQLGYLQGWVPYEGAWGKLVVSGGGYTKDSDAYYYGSFGNIAPGGSSSKQVTLTNDSDVELIVTNAFIRYNGVDGGTPSYCTPSISGATFPLTIAPHDSVTLTLSVQTGFHVGASMDNWQYVFQTDAETLSSVALQTSFTFNPIYFG